MGKYCLQFDDSADSARRHRGRHAAGALRVRRSAARAGALVNDLI